MTTSPIALEMIVFLVILALAFDFMNGFHDAANSIATVVSTRVLRPQWAVAWAAFFNFIAFLVFGLSVANTIGKGVIDPAIVDHYVILGALVGAIAWNVITWWYGLPSSSSHALIGGLAGAAVAKGGVHALAGTGLVKISLAIVLSPMLGFALGMMLMTGVAWLFFRTRPNKVDRWFRRLQLVSAALYSLGHGGNDAQKTMGMRITKLRPVGGFCAESGGAMTLFLATGLGIPVSTTHTITGAIIGVGATHKLSAVRWGVAQNIVWAWVLTIPCSAFISALAWWVVHRMF
jgi:PiT family inorganic phosphate transporter